MLYPVTRTGVTSCLGALPCGTQPKQTPLVETQPSCAQRRSSIVQDGYEQETLEWQSEILRDLILYINEGSGPQIQFGAAEETFQEGDLCNYPRFDFPVMKF